MTILMGFKLDNGAVITADQKRSDLSSDGDSLGSFISVKKVHQIHPHMILATGGLGDLGTSTAELLRSVICINEDISVTKALKYVSNTFQYTYKLFKELNPEITFLDLVAIIGGYDIEKKKSYLYTISSADNFALKEAGNYTRIGPGTDILDKEVNDNNNSWKDFMDVINTFSTAIRKVDSDSVSKSTFSMVSCYESDEYKFGTVILDEEGKEV